MSETQDKYLIQLEDQEDIDHIVSAGCAFLRENEHQPILYLWLTFQRTFSDLDPRVLHKAWMGATALYSMESAPLGVEQAGRQAGRQAGMEKSS